MSKHTPGPWNQALDADLCLYQLTSKSRELVAKAVGQNQETDEANARLIAAAPEMLECLQALLEVDGDLDSLNFDHIRKVVAKAEGRES